MVTEFKAGWKGKNILLKSVDYIFKTELNDVINILNLSTQPGLDVPGVGLKIELEPKIENFWAQAV